MIVLDTHALVWWLAQSPKLSAPARRAIQAAQRGGPVMASAISIFEIATLVRRGRLQLGVSVEQWLAAARALPELRIEPVTDHIAQLAGSFSELMPGDPADRLIAATAIALGTRLVSADKKLQRARGLVAVW